MLDFKGKFAAVLPAGGLGKRMGGNIPKQLLVLGGKPVYRYSLETFLSMDEIAEVVMAVPADWKDHFEKDFSHPKLKIVVGGAERWQSVENGVNALTSNAEFVLVHDVARPFISKEIILDVCKTLVEKGSCLVAKPAVDTIKIAKDGCVQQTIDRNTVWMAQTPQAASIALLKKLYGRIAAEPLNFTPTDEASILEYFGESVYIVKGNNLNDKLTTPEDFEIFASRTR
ncbi:2-C-methyl-D-erythritol 4-phosphate cytidylyltransferase [Fibrobacter sp. UWB1]|jgi:2-C-methyl-D-erythritol 4-phosphate cytidylyltransferase|uniref:2-C-methyl-D-erythritol 4-phosphate cytidylyltransferase n=1 Tax=Fibrobacter sp. UWB1 TaxID=1964355 RepID=UPI000A85C741|nr:2-C-methyl-D-erythritol 4-phosphate cytidylyltransferase [Fibrobacter sp. UWB1]OWV27002.1 2-C-methyl-D-erythritol 4-phosphate cytidylyltransferase [Fibrobacter sp. UWB1]